MSSSKLTGLVHFWQSFDLLKVQSTLDEIATEITERQDKSEDNKKRLIQGIKDFKKEKDELIRVEAAPLIKQFQNEIDSLSKRAKLAEKAFFDVYKRLADMADPVPVLEHALEMQNRMGKVQDLEIENKQLKETVDKCNKEIQEFKSKDKKLVELQSKVDAYDKNIDQTLNEKINEVSHNMIEEYNEKLKVIEEVKEEAIRRNIDLEEKLRSCQKKLKEANAELYEAQSHTEDRTEARSQEVDLLMNDLEVAQMRAAEAEKQVEVMKERIEEIKQSSSSFSTPSSDDPSPTLIATLQRDLSSKEHQVQQLLSDLHKVKAELTRVNSAHKAQTEDLELQLAETAQVAQALQVRLDRQNDYEVIKKELSILKTMEFPRKPTEEEEEEDSKRPLEVMILERSKVLQTENTTLRVKSDRLSEELSGVRRALEEKERESERLKGLVRQLEDHVERLQSLSTGSRGEAEGRSSSDILAEALDLNKTNEDIRLGSPSPSSQDKDGLSSLLPIVQAQRERFRKRNAELEEEQRIQVQQIALLQQQMDNMQKDNVKLYEKIRYLQGYQGVDKSQSSSSQAESRYKSDYEQKLDPFSSFSHQERQRKYGQLNVFEKIILSFVQFMMANKIARLFVFAYSILLHLLVFLVLMKLAYNDAHVRDLAAEWHDKYLRHMQDVHGNEDHVG